MTLHGIKPNMGGMASAHRPQAAVYSSPISSDHLCNVPKGHATMVSSTVSPTSADVSCCSGNRGTTSISASASQHHLHHAAVALQCTKQEIAEWSETAADSAASQVTSLPCVVCLCIGAADCCCSMSCHCLAYTRHPCHILMTAAPAAHVQESIHCFPSCACAVSSCSCSALSAAEHHLNLNA